MRRFLVALVAIGVIVSACSPATNAPVAVGGTTTNTQSTTTSSGRLYPNRPDSQSKDIELALNAGGTARDQYVMAGFDAVTTSFGPYENAATGRQFVTFSVSMGNLGSKTVYTGATDFRLQTTSGQVVDRYYQSKTPELDTVDLIGGGRMSGFITFEVPIESGWNYLIFKPDMFYSDRLIWGVNLPQQGQPSTSSPIVTPSSPVVTTANPLQVVSISSPLKAGDNLVINVHTFPLRDVGAGINVSVEASWYSYDTTTDDQGNATIVLKTEGLLHSGRNTVVVKVFDSYHSSGNQQKPILAKVETSFTVQ